MLPTLLRRIGLAALLATPLALGCTATRPPASAPMQPIGSRVGDERALPIAAARACETQDLGAIRDGVRLELERCSLAPFASFRAVKAQSVTLTASLDEELGAPDAGWRAFSTRFRAVPSKGGGSITSLVFHRRHDEKDAWAIVALELTEGSLRTVARIGPEGAAVLTHAVEDLDGDGIPELRVGIAESFHGERRIETYALGPNGFEKPWAPPPNLSSESMLGPLLCDEADRELRRVSPDAPRVPCDPILDFQRAHVEGPGDRRPLLVASGPYSACDGRGCPLVVLREREGAPEVLLRSFGFVALTPAPRDARVAIAVLKAPGEEAGGRRYCWKHGALARCRGRKPGPALAPWASLAPVRFDAAPD